MQLPSALRRLQNTAANAAVNSKQSFEFVKSKAFDFCNRRSADGSYIFNESYILKNSYITYCGQAVICFQCNECVTGLISSNLTLFVYRCNLRCIAFPDV